MFGVSRARELCSRFIEHIFEREELKKMTLVATSVTLWTNEQGVPERFVWEGERFRVTDTPTPVEFEIGLLTHFTVGPIGWRLQGTNERGDSLMFDIGQFAAGHEWHVIRTYR
jgi:hypothetical protein